MCWICCCCRSIEIYQTVGLKLACTILVHKKLISCLQWHPQFTAESESNVSPCRLWLASASNESVVHVYNLDKSLSNGDLNGIFFVLSHFYLMPCSEIWYVSLMNVWFYRFYGHKLFCTLLFCGLHWIIWISALLECGFFFIVVISGWFFCTSHSSYIFSKHSSVSFPEALTLMLPTWSVSSISIDASISPMRHPVTHWSEHIIHERNVIHT